MTRFVLAFALVSACARGGGEADDDTDGVEADTVWDADGVDIGMDTEPVDTDTVGGDSDAAPVDTVGVDTDVVGVESDTVDTDTVAADTDTLDPAIDPADFNDTVDYGGDVVSAGYDGLCDQRFPGEVWTPETSALAFGEYFGESLLRYGITERSVLAAGGGPTWINIPAEDAEHRPYDPRHAAAPLTLPLVPGEYAIEMQVHRNGRDATWHQPFVSNNYCMPRDPGWVNLDLHTQTWVTIVAGPAPVDTDLVPAADTAVGGP